MTAGRSCSGSGPRHSATPRSQAASATLGCEGRRSSARRSAPEVLLHFSIAARPAVTDDVRELAADTGDDRSLDLAARTLRTTLVGRFNPQTQVREHDAVEVAIDERALHFFDPQSGLAL